MRCSVLSIVHKVSGNGFVGMVGTFRMAFHEFLRIDRFGIGPHFPHRAIIDIIVIVIIVGSVGGQKGVEAFQSQVSVPQRERAGVKVVRMNRRTIDATMSGQPAL